MDDKSLQERLDRIERAVLINTKPVLTIEEAATFTGRTVSAMYHLVQGLDIPHYKQRGRIYFRRTELEDWMLQCPVASRRDVSALASTYVATHRAAL